MSRLFPIAIVALLMSGCASLPPAQTEPEDRPAESAELSPKAEKFLGDVIFTVLGYIPWML